MHQKLSKNIFKKLIKNFIVLQYSNFIIHIPNLMMK